jgi:beta-lactamase regulating signal transducer with metallopeptidase domain
MFYIIVVLLFLLIIWLFGSLCILLGMILGYSSMPYNYDVIKIYEGEAEEVSLLEQKLNHINKEHSYLPLLEFKGRHECFSEIILSD